MKLLKRILMKIKKGRMRKKRECKLCGFALMIHNPPYKSFKGQGWCDLYVIEGPFSGHTQVSNIDSDEIYVK